MAIGTSDNFGTLITNLITLEHDAIAAYNTVIERLENPSYRQEIESFKADHDRHMRELTDLARTTGADIPEEGDMKEYLTTGKVALADMVGNDESILKAMASNESDTVEAYKNASSNTAVPADSRPIFERALADEQRHKAWMESAGHA